MSTVSTGSDTRMASTGHFRLTPLTPTIGAEITGIALSEQQSDDCIAQIYQALLDWKVIFFRDQPVSAEQHLAFASRFGELEVHPFVAQNEQHPQLLRITHDREHPGTENIWHSDVTWREKPSLGSILHVRAAPQTGGDTLFADMTAAYKGLPETIRAQVEGQTAQHDFAAFRRKMRERGASDDEIEAFNKQFPNPSHPVIRTHPDTGEKAIYVNRAFTQRIIGMPDDKSRELLSMLYQQAAFPEYQCRFKWTSNSIAFWDNRACQHYACSDYWPQIRKAERATIIGTKPVYEPTAWSAHTVDDKYRGVLRRFAHGELAHPGLQFSTGKPLTTGRQ